MWNALLLLKDTTRKKFR